MINTISNALSGMMSASKKLDNAANNIANADTKGFEDVNVTEELIGTLVAEQDFKANAVVLSRAKDMQEETNRLLDIKA